ncbi:monofunctional biosynthetic peptidoglycan transglycosylase [Tropicimonas sp. IMCC6043]|uniref:monofunctional biosynthetic peptidoglycan transglycosylase n=1 Tax=Tropicimonas sp. IMCC6043 TaxID=2510645 RepID=UPI00101D352B|nr:monofunctional biosynthetic peptidoglycan transglycosylase [Tropicimonas sp. IMCC6043]RYH09968.1 monofunctional biosynthetic peptidoglycan transglycosylase [Tropicimonas sp. IMCC6043]
MARAKSRKPAGKAKARRGDGRLVRIARALRRWTRLLLLAPILLVVLLILLFRVVNPPTTHTIWSESRRIGGVEREWVPLEEISPDAARAVVAAEDANFCLHWGFDMAAIRDALDDGARRGASTLTQQTVKNVFLWQERSWLRKALEATLTPAVELLWPKRRILEVYLNVAEMDEGIFGIEAAAESYFGRPAADLTVQQAARIAAVLPAPKSRDADNPSPWLRRRADSIVEGAATIAADGRAACFED